MIMFETYTMCLTIIHYSLENRKRNEVVNLSCIEVRVGIAKLFGSKGENTK